MGGISRNEGDQQQIPPSEGMERIMNEGKVPDETFPYRFYEGLLGLPSFFLSSSYPLMAPLAIPFTICFCISRKKIKIGTSVITVIVINIGQLTVNSPLAL